MPKFVLIDHSIVDIGGHYYEYAARVLATAEAAGYESVLATNRRLRTPGPLARRVVPVYRYDFFEPGPPKLLVNGRRWLGRWRRRAARLKYRLMFSRLGLLWFKQREGAAAGAITSRGLLAAAVAAGLTLYVLRIATALARLLLAIVPVRSYLRNVLTASRQAAAVAAWPWRACLAQGSIVWQHAHRWRKRSAFAADSVRLFREVRLEKGDVVFIPTLAEEDMLGLLTLFQTNPETASASWHLIFRRNIYQNRDPDYVAQDESLRPLRNSFRRFQSQLHGQRVYFYTDTEALTIQYNRLGVAPFRTLPIPVAADYRADSQEAAIDNGRNLTDASERLFHVVYVGDARTEKGYQWLPHLVGDAFARRLPVRFTFQSNFNVPHGEPAPVVARAQLQSLPAECRVDLLMRPLGSDAYRRLVLDGDVVVIPYDRDNYYARSSGIFAEALVAGKPVLVPGGTWMATELNAAICDYHERLRRCVVAQFATRDLSWRTPFGKLRGDRDFVDGDELPVLGNSPTRCWFRVPDGATHLLVTFKVGGPCQGVFPGIACDQFASGRRLAGRAVSMVGGAADGRASALVRLDCAARRVRLGLSNSLSAAPITLKDVRIEFLSSIDSLPAGVVGAIYAEPNELGDHVRELLDHYEHYRATAVEFSRAWSDYHCAERLIGQLTCDPTCAAHDCVPAADASAASTQPPAERGLHRAA